MNNLFWFHKNIGTYYRIDTIKSTFKNKKNQSIFQQNRYYRAAVIRISLLVNSNVKYKCAVCIMSKWNGTIVLHLMDHIPICTLSLRIVKATYPMKIHLLSEFCTFGKLFSISEKQKWKSKSPISSAFWKIKRCFILIFFWNSNKYLQN